MSQVFCHGQIEHYTAGELVGWACWPDAPERPILLLAVVDGLPRAACLANLKRGDLIAAGIGNGYHGFRVALRLVPGETVRLISPHNGQPLLPAFTYQDELNLPVDAEDQAPSDHGNIDQVQGSVIKGWCWQPGEPSRHLRVSALVDGVVAAQTIANEERGDLVEAGIGIGDHAFTLEMPYGLLDGRKRQVEITAEGIGRLHNSPVSFCSTDQGPNQLLARLIDAIPEERRAELAGNCQLLTAYLEATAVTHPRSIGWAQYEDWLRATRAMQAAAPEPVLVWTAEGITPQDCALRYQGPAGDMLVLVDGGVRLHPGALDRARLVFEQRDADFLYADADMVQAGQPPRPWFRPDWNYDLFLAQDYTRGLVLIRASLFADGIIPPSLPAIKMAALERARTDRILHLPEVLASIEQPAENAALWQEIVAAHLRARGFGGAGVAPHPRWPDLRTIHWPRPAMTPPVSLIIPTRDRLDLLRPCIDSILSRTRYQSFEIIIINNQSREAETLAYLEQGQRLGWFRVMTYDAPFNYADMNNRAADLARGAVLGFINNDVELITPDWLGEAISLLSRPEVGAVGARLRFANGMIQHAGVILGTGGLAENAFQQYHVDDEGYFGRTQVAGNYSAVTAACLFCRRQDFLNIGGFDAQNLPVAFNDVDLCLRWRQKGLLMVWTPRIELYHYESVSRGRDMSPDRKARSDKEMHYMRNRWYRQAMADPYYNPNLNLDGRPFRGLALPARHQWGGPVPESAFPLWPVQPSPASSTKA
ncbi:Glycosyltransferase, GT2 family [Azospirillum sp. RU38E]|nr:Glycosyltransferase, GT2 family [Azospirillum sp. RU38E]SNS03079.1 Glycosyltransferase, GT2 family [Azospirillum sp. RU37A]